MKIIKLNQCVFSFTPDPWEFLNGITSNSRDAAHNAFLDHLGRVVAVFHQFEISSIEMGIVLASSLTDRVQDHMKNYLNLSDCRLRRWPHHVYYDLDGTYALSEGEVGLKETVGALVISERSIDQSVSQEEFTRYRVDHNIPMQGIDFDRDLVLNIGERYVSHTKGCYLGQEIVARVHQQGKPPRKLVVAEASELTQERQSKMTSKIKHPGSGETRGFIFAPNP